MVYTFEKGVEMNDLNLALCEMVNEPSEYLLTLKKEHPRVYEALAFSYKRQTLFQSFETMMLATKEELASYGENIRNYRLNGFTQTYTVPYMESYEAYEKEVKALEEKYKNPGSGYAANTMGKGLAGQKLRIFQKHYQGYEARRQAYLV